MNSRYLLGIIGGLCLISPLKSQVYVNASAEGGNDGSSWENAYTQLQVALENSLEGDEIWIAAGTYLPGREGDSSASFIINKNIKIYGGFSGLETQLEERDLSTHPTILSGDLEGNDDPSNFTLNREDNAFHVIWIDASITNSTLLNGLFVQGGHADGDINTNLGQSRGGGIYSRGAPIIQNCKIRNNYALNDGGGIYLDSVQSSGTQILNCEIINNHSDDDGGGIEAVFAYQETIRIDSCIVQGNTASAVGAGIHIKSSNIQVSNSQILDNVSESFGGGIHIEQLRDVPGIRATLDNCEIHNNRAINSGAGMVYYSNDNDQFLSLTRVRFQDNLTNESGGGLYLELWLGHEDSPIELHACQFFQNNAPFQDGGAIYARVLGTNSTISIESTRFDENTAALRGGALFADYNQDSSHHVRIENSEFFKNLANSGGAIEFSSRNRSGTKLEIVGSQFTSNEANPQGGEGGALKVFAQGEPTEVSMRDCRMEDNSAQNGGGIFMEVAPGRRGVLELQENVFHKNRSMVRGGGINTATRGGNMKLNLHKIHFTENRAPFGAGLMSEVEIGGDAAIRIDSTLFLRNVASVSAGGMLLLVPDEFSSAQLEIFAGEFRENRAVENVGGLAISADSDDFNGEISHSIFKGNRSTTFGGLFVQQSNSQVTSSSLEVSNSLFIEHQAPAGATIGSFSFPVNLTNCTLADNNCIGLLFSAQSVLTLQNTLLHNPGFSNLARTDTLATAISLGGNLSSDTSLDPYLNEQDISNVEPLFIGGSFAPYRLENNSPGIDAGVSLDSMPETDLSGIPRVQGASIDIGAYEGGFSVSNSSRISQSRPVLYPNPVGSLVTVSWEGASENYQIDIFDPFGRRILGPTLSSSFPYDINLTKLRPGIYMLRIIGNTESIYIPFEKL